MNAPASLLNLGIEAQQFVWSLSGVYAISCSGNGKVYVGCSKNIPERLRSHINKLSAGSHKNIHMQRAWAKFGRESFYAYVVQYASHDVFDQEVSWIKDLGSYENGFNMTKGGEGVKNDEAINEKRANTFKKRYSEETRAKKSAIAKKQYASMSEESRKTFQEAGRVAAANKIKRMGDEELIDRSRALSEFSKKRWSSIGKEERSVAAKAIWKSKTKEERSASANKSWETRRRNAALKDERTS